MNEILSTLGKTNSFGIYSEVIILLGLKLSSELQQNVQETESGKIVTAFENRVMGVCTGRSL